MSVPWLLIRYGTNGTAPIPPPIIPPEPRPVPINSGAGYIVGKHSGPYGPAFPRSVRELYRQLPTDQPGPVEEIADQPSPAIETKKSAQPIGSPLPIIMQLAAGPAVLGIRTQAEILDDDEDAIAAILLALQ